MKAKASPLRLNHFELVESQYKFIEPKQDFVEDVAALFETYPLEVDFSNDLTEDGFIQVGCAVKVNGSTKPKAGYSMYTMAFGVFAIEGLENLDERTAGNLRFYSTLNMMINNLRNIIFQQSNLGPMKGYLLPPIDILDLFDKKKKEMERGKKGKGQ